MYSSSPTIKSRDGLGDNTLTGAINVEIRHWFYLCIISNDCNVAVVVSRASQGSLGCTLLNDRIVPSCKAKHHTPRAAHDLPSHFLQLYTDLYTDLYTGSRRRGIRVKLQVKVASHLVGPSNIWNHFCNPLFKLYKSTLGGFEWFSLLVWLLWPSLYGPL